MSGAFSFSDLGRVHWVSTIKIALARGLMAGLIFTAIQIIWPTSGAELTATKLAIMPFFWMVFALPIALILQFAGWVAGMFIPLLGLFITAVGSLCVCIGDPLVYLFNRFFPVLLNVADFKFFNFQPIIFITHPE